MSKPTISVDFDGTVHSYERGWQDGSIYGTVVPGFFEWLHQVADQYQVVIYSTRSATSAGIQQMRDWLHDQHQTWEFGDNARPGLPSIGWPTTKPKAIIAIDDRALTFRGDWSAFDADTLAAFRPWTQQEQAMAKDDQVNPEHILHIVTDATGHKTLERIFKTYVQDEELWPRIPAFLLAADRLLAQMGGRPIDQDQKAKEDAEREQNKKDGGKDGDGKATRGKPAKQAPDEDDDDYDQDEDVHKEQSADWDADRIRTAVRRLLG